MWGNEKDIKWHVACVAEAVAFIQERGVTRRDFKPPNLLLDAQGSTVLLPCHEVLAMMQPWIGGRLVVFFLNYGQASPCLQEKPMIFSVQLRASIWLVQQAFRDATA